MLKKISIAVIGLVIIVGGFLLNKLVLQRVTDAPGQVFSPNSNLEVDLEDAPPITTYVGNRQIIWAMAFLPDGKLMFTERNGGVSMVGPDGQITNIHNVAVYASGESGLHGVVIDPDFNDNHFIYLYYTYRGEGANTLNRVSRFVFEDNKLINEQVIVDGIPGASTHDGGRIKFGPDSFLYITTGDAQAPSSSQNKDSLAGKILRVTRDGQAAPGNPFNNLVYSYGHRNPQGIAWDNQGRLWATEHGPSTRDELNLIEAGSNYGWPDITGTNTRDGMRTPVIQSGSGTWAPAGAQYLDGSIYFTGLRGSALYQYDIKSDDMTTHLKNKLGRIRDVVLGPDDFFYIATSNRDGRGVPLADDDRILKINPLKLDEI